MNKDPLVLFDMDGVIVNSQAAIINSLNYALSEIGVDPVPFSELSRHIGPPLNSMLAAILPHSSDKERKLCATTYRLHNDKYGPSDSTIYPGIEDALSKLNERYILRIATSKSEESARALIKHKGLDRFFNSVHGARPNSSEPKAEVIRSAQNLHFLQCGSRFTLAIIGDRRHDIEAAADLGIPSIGCRWGYAEPGEIDAANPNYIVSSPDELVAVLEEVSRLS